MRKATFICSRQNPCGPPPTCGAKRWAITAIYRRYVGSGRRSGSTRRVMRPPPVPGMKSNNRRRSSRTGQSGGGGPGRPEGSPPLSLSTEPTDRAIALPARGSRRPLAQSGDPQERASRRPSPMQDRCPNRLLVRPTRRRLVGLLRLGMRTAGGRNYHEMTENMTKSSAR